MPKFAQGAMGDWLAYSAMAEREQAAKVSAFGMGDCNCRF
jgi:hypothetical protein